MRVTPPIEITPSILTDTSCAEPHSTETAYSGAATYGEGDQVISTTDHWVWESAVAGNSGNALPAAGESNAYWLSVGPTNRWRMFDLIRNTGTTDASPLEVELTPGMRVDTLALVGLVADTVTIEVTSVGGGGTVYSATVDLREREVVSWYGYFFEPFSFRSSVYFNDLPPYSDAVITVTMERATGDVTCGSVILGTGVYIGATIAGAENDALNFSTIDRDEFGDSVLIRRRSVPKLSPTLIAMKTNVNRIRQAREALNAVPALWSGLDDQEDDYFDAVLILGIYKRFTITLDQPAPEYATVSLELEEV